MRVFCNMMQRALSFVYSIDQLNIDKSFIIINQLGHYRSVVLTAGKHTTARVVLGRVGGGSSPHVPVGLLRIYESTADQSFPSPQASGHGPLGLEPGLRRPRRHTLGRRQQVVHAAPLPHAPPPPPEPVAAEPVPTPDAVTAPAVAAVAPGPLPEAVPAAPAAQPWVLCAARRVRGGLVGFGGGDGACSSQEDTRC